ncbi:MAG: hypothetical protein L3J56_03355 [Bacteroidales bacterium]|nr:hypothetical protein [Bacteroidales bacterium]
MKRLILSTIVLFSVILTFSQTGNIRKDKVKYTPAFKFKDGIFLNFQQVKDNNPVPKSQILTTIDYNAFDFYNKLFQNKYITIYDNLGIQKKINTSRIWGFSNRGVLFINLNDEFNRIPVFGSISHFTANKTIQEYDPYRYNNSYYYYNDSYSEKTVLMQYLLDFETGKIYDFNVKSVEAVISKDPELYEEFSKLSKRKKNKLKFVYIRKYNQKHPVYFPKN